MGFQDLSSECFLLLCQVFKPCNFVTNKIIQNCNLLNKSDVVSHIKPSRYCSLFCNLVKAHLNYCWAFCSVKKVDKHFIFFFYQSCALSKCKSHHWSEKNLIIKLNIQLHLRILQNFNTCTWPRKTTSFSYSVKFINIFCFLCSVLYIAWWHAKHDAWLELLNCCCFRIFICRK